MLWSLELREYIGCVLVGCKSMYQSMAILLWSEGRVNIVCSWPFSAPGLSTAVCQGLPNTVTKRKSMLINVYRQGWRQNTSLETCWLQAVILQLFIKVLGYLRACLSRCRVGNFRESEGPSQALRYCASSHLQKGVCMGNLCCPVLLSWPALCMAGQLKSQWLESQCSPCWDPQESRWLLPALHPEPLLCCSVTLTLSRTDVRRKGWLLSASLSWCWGVSSPKEVYHRVLSCALLGLQSKAVKQTVEGYAFVCTDGKGVEWEYIGMRLCSLQRRIGPTQCAKKMLFMDYRGNKSE